MKAQQIDWCACASEVHATICGKGESELAMEPSRLYENALWFHICEQELDHEVELLRECKDAVSRARYNGTVDTIQAMCNEAEQRHAVLKARFELKQAHYAIKYPQFA